MNLLDFKLGISILLVLSTSVLGAEEQLDLKGVSDKELNSLLAKAASQINENLPMMVDSETRLDATYGINKQFIYNYTLVNYTRAEINSEDFANSMRPKLENYVCTTKEMQIFINNDISVKYTYYGKEKKHIAEVVIRKADCGK